MWNKVEFLLWFLFCITLVVVCVAFVSELVVVT